MTTTTPPGSPGSPNGIPPTQAPPPGVEIIDLTPAADQLQPKWFRIGPRPDDVFCAAPSVPVMFGVEYVHALAARDDEERTAAEQFIDLLAKVLLPGHRERFAARYTDVEHPIDHRLLFAISDRLLEEYGLRPPRPSEPSSDGSSPQDDGTSNADEPPAEGSTSPESPSTEPSTSPTASSSPA